LFTGLSRKYDSGRPGYPPEVLDLLQAELGITEGCIIADLGAGTGILSKLLLESGYVVYGIEPNSEMRKVAEKTLAVYPKFYPVAATAENTLLPDQCIDLVTIAQALHLFDLVKTRKECLRILKNNAPVMLIWNFADLQSNYFRDYKRYLFEHGVHRERLATSVKQIENEHEDKIKAFFDRPYSYCVVKHWKDFTWDKYFDCCFSSPELPSPETPAFNSAVDGLRKVFDRNQNNGILSMEYHARTYWGLLNA